MVINDPQILAEVEFVFARYEAALISNDVTVLDELFWGSAHTIRYGPAESLYGQDEILAFRKARPSAGLDRMLRRTVITTFGNDHATANTEFIREGTTKIGRQSQTWVRMLEGWRVVAAHVSLRERTEDDA
ncbi:oxalurate catabolism protein HpxZ [Ahrensia marina]|uniref:oxalurate catabolism protein HpxZ n=1 Tax=Ahrensia marina TaxID=1514904 RepID=UPI0035CF34BC